MCVFVCVLYVCVCFVCTWSISVDLHVSVNSDLQMEALIAEVLIPKDFGTLYMLRYLPMALPRHT